MPQPFREPIHRTTGRPPPMPVARPMCRAWTSATAACITTVKPIASMSGVSVQDSESVIGFFSFFWLCFFAAPAAGFQEETNVTMCSPSASPY